MLAFFNKHQKKFIGFTIVVVAVSGIGLGWGKNTHEDSSYRGSKKVVFSVPGRKYSEKEFLALKRFFINEAYPFTGDPQKWNFLNEGLLTERFLTNKVGEKLFLKTYASDNSVFKKEQHYQSYRRFDTPFISAEEVWKSSAPRLLQALTTLQQIENPVSSEGYMARVQLFLEEKKFPHYILRQMLEYRRQMFNLPHDSALVQGKDLCLFGYHNIADWFGEAYVTAALETLLRFINEQKKTISMPSAKEARQDFYDKAQQAFTKLGKHANMTMNFDEFVASYFEFLGVDEADFLKMYREILLCKRAFLHLEGGVIFDYRPLQEFFSMAKDSTSLEIYKLPKEYLFKSREDLEAFETYIGLVGTPVKDYLDIPRQILPVKTIKSKEPNLVGRRFCLSYKKVRLEDLETKVPMVEVLRWQQVPENFQILLQQFPCIETYTSSRDFQSLKPSTVEKIYSFTRREILRAHPERIQEGLSQCKHESHEVFLSAGKDSMLEGIEDGNKLASLLLENEILEVYSQDGEHYYTFIVDSCCSGEEVIPYREVLRKGLAKSLVNAHSNPAHMEAVVSALKARYNEEENEDLWQKRLWGLVQEHRHGSFQTGSFSWNLEKSIKVFSRGDEGSPCSYSELSSMKEGSLSDITFNSEFGPFFYKCLSHQVCSDPANISKLFWAKGHLNEEILGSYIEEFLG